LLPSFRYSEIDEDFHPKEES